MQSNAQASLMSRAAPQEQPSARRPPDEDLFTRTILTAARKAYYNPQQQPQILQMVQSGASPGAGVAMAALSILQMVGETLNEQGKQSPPELLFNPDGPIDYIVEDLSELAAAEFGVPVEQVQSEADALVDEQLSGGGQGQTPSQEMPPQAEQPVRQPSLMASARQGVM